MYLSNYNIFIINSVMISGVFCMFQDLGDRGSKLCATAGSPNGGNCQKLFDLIPKDKPFFLEMGVHN